MSQAHIVVAKVISRYPYTVDAQSVYYGPQGGTQLMKALHDAKEDPKAVCVSYFEGNIACHIDIDHSLISFEK